MTGINMNYHYEYPRPAVTTDMIIINKRNMDDHILLIRRLNNPYKDCWALPGGFVDENEPLLKAAERELMEETSLAINGLQQFKTYGDPGRDPRGHTITVIYYAIVTHEILKAVAGDDAKQCKWFKIDELPELAFDHKKVIEEFIQTVYKQKNHQ